jgi:hypothetical protein
MSLAGEDGGASDRRLDLGEPGGVRRDDCRVTVGGGNGVRTASWNKTLSEGRRLRIRRPLGWWLSSVELLLVDEFREFIEGVHVGLRMLPGRGELRAGLVQRSVGSSRDAAIALRGMCLVNSRDLSMLFQTPTYMIGAD